MIYFILVISLFFQAACTKKSGDENQPNEPMTEAQLLARGQSVYMSNCIACHNSDPKVSGALGPDVYGSSKELLTSKVLQGTYPNAYNPKRNTKIMRPLPQFKNDIEPLYLFLNK